MNRAHGATHTAVGDDTAPPRHADDVGIDAAVRRSRGWRGGWWRAARKVPSPNHNARPDGAAVDLVVLHSISLPPGEYGGDAVLALFGNTLDHDAHPYFAGLVGLRVSSHFFIRRDGRVLQHVSCDERAWHAGVSRWRGREGCNDVSIGIELEGLEGLPFDAPQYRSLVTLVRALARRYPVRDVVGHEHVAPGRKGDPGAGFDWTGFAAALARPRVAVGVGVDPEAPPAAPAAGAEASCGEPARRAARGGRRQR